jgi:hypothetical protein
MFLTGEGALVAVALAVMVCGLIGAWSLLCLAARWLRGAVPRNLGEPGQVRRVIVPAGTTPRV